jgi:hypothetical protein
MLLRLVLWNLADSQTTIAELRQSRRKSSTIRPVNRAPNTASLSTARRAVDTFVD